MTTIIRSLISVCIVFCGGQVAMAQTLAPRAYVITPVNGNAITLSWSFYDGGLNLNGAVPVTGATGAYHVPALSYYHSFRLFGRSANITGLLAYAPFRELSLAISSRFIALAFSTLACVSR